MSLSKADLEYLQTLPVDQRGEAIARIYTEKRERARETMTEETRERIAQTREKIRRGTAERQRQERIALIALKAKLARLTGA